MNPVVQQLMKWSWRFLISGLFLLVVSVGLCRLLFSTLPLLQPYVSRILSEKLQAQLQVEEIQSQWQGGEPSLSLKGLSLKGLSLKGLSPEDKNADLPGLRIDRLDMELDLRDSLFKWMPVFNSLQINGVALNLDQVDGVKWNLSGIRGIAGSSVLDDSAVYEKPHEKNRERNRLLKWLDLQEHLDIRDISLTLRKTSGESSQIRVRELFLASAEGQKKLAARLEVGEEGFLEVAGQGERLDRWNTDWAGVARASQLNSEQLCALWSGCHDAVDEALLEMDVRWNFRSNRWQLAGRLASPRVSYRDPDGRWNRLSVETQLFMQGIRESQWQIWLSELALENTLSNGVSYQWQSDWYLSGGKSGEQGAEYSVTVATENLNLTQLKRWLLDTAVFPEEVNELVRTLNPSGELNDFVARCYPSRKPFDFDLSAQLSNVSVDAWEGVPSGGNISGSVRTGLLKGYLDLDAENFRLGFPELFRETWQYDTAKARLYWDVVDDTYILKSDELALSGPEGDLKGRLRLDIPLDWGEDDTLDMALTVGMSNGDARYTGKYLPVGLPMDSQLTQWLDSAIRGASIHEGGFIYNGALVGEEGNGRRPEDARWGLFFDVTGAEVDYSPEWPPVTDLSGQVFVNDNRVEVLADQARSAGGQLKGVTARVILDDDPVVYLRSRLVADGSTARYFLTRTPIDEMLQGEAKQWELEGDLQGDLKLSLPIERLDAFTVDFKAALEGFRFAVPERKVDVADITGELSFSNRKGLRSQSLVGEFMGQKTEFQIQSAIDQDKPDAVQISWAGELDVVDLQDWLNLDWLSLLEGRTDYNSQLWIRPDQGTTELQVRSQLQGVEFQLPPPLDKPAASSLPLTLTLLTRNDQHELNVSLGEMARLSLDMKPDFSMDSGSLALGPDGTLVKAVGNQFVVTGSLPELDIEPWKQRFEGQPGRPDEQNLASRLEISNLLIRRLKFGENQWRDVGVSLKSEQGTEPQKGRAGQQAVKLSVDSAELAGSLWIPGEAGQPYRVDIARLSLPEPEEKSSDQELPDVLGDVNPALLPDLDVLIRQIRLGSRDPGAIAFQLRHEENGARIDQFSSQLQGMGLTGFADWVQVDSEQRSWFQGKLDGSSIDRLQEALGIPGFMEAQESRFDANLNWQGSPLGARFREMKGRIDLNLKKGRLKKLEGSSGALKLFGILNTEALSRRLQLDFSDLYAKGISFDEIRGSLRFTRGVITFDSPIIIEGPSSNFKIDGTIDGNKQQLDLSMVVTLPVSSNLPILSVLLGTAPQVAGIIYIADKLVGKQVDQLASIRYKIKGSFDDPEITLDQLFSSQPVANQPEKSKPDEKK